MSVPAAPFRADRRTPCRWHSGSAADGIRRAERSAGPVAPSPADRCIDPATGPGTIGGRQAGCFTHSRPRCMVPGGQMHWPAIGPGTIGGRQVSCFTHSRPRCTVPGGQMHWPETGPGIIGGRQVSCFTHSRPRCTVPGGQMHWPSTGPWDHRRQAGFLLHAFAAALHGPRRTDALTVDRAWDHRRQAGFLLHAFAAALHAPRRTDAPATRGRAPSAARRQAVADQACPTTPHRSGRTIRRRLCTFAIVAQAVCVKGNGGVAVGAVTVTVMQFFRSPVCPVGIWTTILPEKLIGGTVIASGKRDR